MILSKQSFIFVFFIYCSNTFAQFKKPSQRFSVSHKIEPFNGVMPKTEQLKSIPEFLEGTGLFKDLWTLTPIEGMTPYKILSELWSDGVLKERFIGISRNEMIKNQEDKWIFPLGTIFVKHFFVEALDNSLIPLETRLLVVGSNGVYPVTYAWDPSNKTKPKITRFEKILQVPKNKQDIALWRVPGRRQCAECHKVNNPILGFEELQINRKTDDSGGVNQLVRFSEYLFFEKSYSPEDTKDLQILESHTKVCNAKSVASYLHTNCSFCHNPQNHNFDFDFRFKDSISQFFNVPVRTANDLGIYLIEPGKPERSAILNRMRTFDGSQMPPLAVKSEDMKATACFSDVIKSQLEVTF